MSPTRYTRLCKAAFSCILLLLSFVSYSQTDSSVVIESLDFALDSLNPEELKIKARNDSILLTRLDSADMQKKGRKTISLAPIRKDTAAEDSTGVKLDYKILSSSKDSTVSYFTEGKVHLWGDAKVEYGDLKITAHHIEIDRNTNQVYASPKLDSLGNPTFEGMPNFEQGSDKFIARHIKFNFKTKKGYIKEVFTKQDEGYLHGERSKKHESGNIHIEEGKFTTCPYGHSTHFHMHLTRAIVQPNDKTVADLSYLVVAGTPLPFILPFGVFPSTSESSQGILFPSFGQDFRKGIYLQDFGYYMPLYDYADVAVRASLYSRGSRDYEVTSRFSKRYAFSGDFNYKYLRNVTGTLGALDFEESTSYNLRFNWRQDPKADPTSNFSASVNYQTSDFNRNDIDGQFDPNQYLQASINSSMSYSKRFEFGNLSLSANASQNTKTQSVNLTLPRFTFNSLDIFLFKKKSAGTPKWYNKLKTKITLSGNNNITAKEDEIFSKSFRDYKQGLSYRMPFGASETFWRFFNFNYSMNLNGAIMTKKLEPKWFTRQDPTFGKDTLVTDTVHGVYNTFNVGPSLGLSFRPKVYVMFNFLPGFKVNAIRHVITPSISFNYTPNIGLDPDAYFTRVQSSRRGDVRKLSLYNGLNSFGAPGRGGSEQGSMSFSLDNNVEMKLNDGFDKDGNQKTKKVVLIRNLNFSSSYNLYKDSLNLSPIRMSARTSIFGTSINYTSSFQPYAVDTATGRLHHQYEFEKNGILARPTNANLAFSLNFDNKKVYGFLKNTFLFLTGQQPDEEEGKKKDSKANTDKSKDLEFSSGRKKKKKKQKENSYLKEFEQFKLPWTFSMSYSMRYNNRYLRERKDYKSQFQHFLSSSGNLTLTDKTKLNFRADYDFENYEIASFNMGITRDMHCWQASFNWVPFGNYRSFNFRLSLKSSMLSDTFKYETDRRYNYEF